MSVLINTGYRFALNPDIIPDGGIILAATIPMHTLVRRKINQYEHLGNRFFDPQLYMAGLDPNQSGETCAILASYSWFGVDGLIEYESDQQSQSAWRRGTLEKITEKWPRNPINSNINPDMVRDVVRDCIDFQIQLGCSGIILPSPLTYDPGTNYSEELFWLDTGINYVRSRADLNIPVFATIALADNCVRYSDPIANPLLDTILDSVGAREVDGVYLVIEQGSESNESRHISNTRLLWSALHLVHTFKNDIGFRVGVNFFGAFGLALEAAGAEFWASGWYKSVYRLRIADKLKGGRAFPSLWSNSSVVDINLESDFDALATAGIVGDVADVSSVSDGLFRAAASGVPTRSVPSWEYRQSNVTAAQDHYMTLIVQAERQHSVFSGKDRLDFVENWLIEAANKVEKMNAVLGQRRKTKIEHVQSWLDSFRLYRRDHNV